ncbi:hypothetical protein KC336_g67 [Hortaea werneckii]|nr:hypothetical protein KC336_g67 [Hortaea werneckii]
MACTGHEFDGTFSGPPANRKVSVRRSTLGVVIESSKAGANIAYQRRQTIRRNSNAAKSFSVDLPHAWNK